MVASGLNALFGRATLVAGSLALVFGAFTLTGTAPAIWRATVVCTGVFYALAHAIPDVIFRVQSMPYTYQLHNNFGARGFELQNVTYAAYHTHWYNHATHAAFPLEAWLWFVVAAHWGGALGLAALCSVLCAQAFSFGERRFALGVSTLWIGFAASAGVALAMLGEGVFEIAQLGLVSFGFWRFTGHWVEPLPPGVVGNRGFVRRADANAGWRLCLPLALGYLSEFAAGLPFRLVNSWLFRAAEQLGYRPRRALGLNRTHEFAIRIHEQGWSAQATTAALVSAARELGVDRPSARGVSPARGERTMSSPQPFSIRLMACDHGASVWLIELAGRTLLFDAWLDDPYFSGPAGFFSAHRREPPLFSASSLPRIDALVLSSAEQDHAHPQTLAKLDRRIPVYARPEAARLAGRLGFARVTALAPGESARLFDGGASLLALAGYGRNTPFVLRESASGERLCIAQHGVNARWLAKHAHAAFSGEFAADSHGRLVDTLCLGVHTTLLRPFRLPSWVLGDAGTILPDPLDSAAIVARMSPRRVLFSHATPEIEQGFATRHLLRYPSAPDDLGHALRAFRERAPGPRIAGLPAPAAWL